MPDSASSRPFYDREASRYDRRWRHYQAATHQALLAHLKGKFRRVLDVGCGTGTLLELLLDRYPAAKGIGFDSSAGMLAVAQRRLAEYDVDLRQADALRLPLPDQSVDLVTLASVLHYLRRPSVALLEAGRVSRPGGTVAVVDYVLNVGTSSFLDGLIRLYDPGHARCRGIDEIRRLTTRAGLTVVHAESFPIDRLFLGVLVLARTPADTFDARVEAPRG
ncbi:MAG TPA: methyltransferase domain-containing protein [Chloroflexota bacterium]|nr:methyltransferase domain-containing protein [Chloroflexota bacterium]